MRTLLALLAIAAAALGPAAAASAKEIASVKVCGADGCHDVTARATHAVLDGGPPTTAPDVAAPYYRIKVKMRVEGGEAVAGWTNLWVPSAELLRGDDGAWMTPASTTVDALKLLARGVEPLAAEGLTLPAPEGAPARAPAPADGGLPTVVWAFIVAGALGITLALARAAVAAVAARRRRSAPAA